MSEAPADLKHARNAHQREVFELYDIYREYVIHEDTLIGQRTQRMLLVQGALFTAGGTVFGKMFAEIQPLLSDSKVCRAHAVQTLTYVAALTIIASTGILAAHLSRGALRAAAAANEQLNKKWRNTNRLWKRSGKATARDLHLPGLRGGGSRLVHDQGQRHILIMPIYLMSLWTVLLCALAFAAFRFRYCL